MVDVMEALRHLVRHNNVEGLRTQLAQSKKINSTEQINARDSHQIGLGSLTTSETNELISEALRLEAFACLVEMIICLAMQKVYIEQKYKYIVKSLLDHDGVHFDNDHYNSAQYKDGSLSVIQAVCRRYAKDSFEDNVLYAVQNMFETWECVHSPLVLAVLGNNLPVVQYFVELGMSVNSIIDEDKLSQDSPVIKAILMKSVEMTRYMFENGSRFSSEIARYGYKYDDSLPKTMVTLIDHCFTCNDSENREEISKKYWEIRSDLFCIMIKRCSRKNPMHYTDLPLVFMEDYKRCVDAFLERNEIYVWKMRSRARIPTAIARLKDNQIAFGQIVSTCCVDHIDMVLTRKEKLDIDVDGIVLPSYVCCEDMMPAISPFQYVTPLQFTLLQLGETELLSLLLSHGADINGRGRLNIHPLFLIRLLSIEDDEVLLDLEGVEYLRMMLRHGCDVDADIVREESEHDIYQKPGSLLEYFAIHRNLPMCKFLLVAGARRYDQKVVDEKNFFGHDILPKGDLPSYPKRLCLSEFFTNEDVSSFMRTQLRVPSLQDLTRITIRSLLPGNIGESVKELSLPDAMINFLNLGELDDPQSLCSEFF